MPTVHQTLRTIRDMGLTCSHRDGEYRVNLTRADGGTEATAYYTTDAQDAIDTAGWLYRNIRCNLAVAAGCK